MSTSDPHRPIDTDRRMAQRTAIGLGIWLTITFAVVILLLLFGDGLTSLFV